MQTLPTQLCSEVQPSLAVQKARQILSLQTVGDGHVPPSIPIPQ